MSSFDGFDTTAGYVLLRSGHRAPQDFYDAIRDQIEDFIPSMQFGVTYTAKKMCGSEFWRLLEGAESLAGECVSDMARRGLLPLDFAGKTSKNARLYTPK